MSCFFLRWVNQYVLFEMDGFGGMDPKYMGILTINHSGDGHVVSQWIKQLTDSYLPKIYKDSVFINHYTWGYI